jgi:Ca2+-binding RTX toxin-like protein
MDGGSGVDNARLFLGTGGGTVDLTDPSVAQEIQGVTLVNIESATIFGSALDNSSYNLTGGVFDDDFVGGAGDDVLLGAGGNDRLGGGFGGSDVLEGGDGDDHFVFTQHSVDQSGTTVIQDFGQESGNDDTIEIRGYGFRDFSELDMEEVNGNTVIHLAATEDLTVIGTTPNQLTASDFEFFLS